MPEYGKNVRVQRTTTVTITLTEDEAAKLRCKALDVPDGAVVSFNIRQDFLADVDIVSVQVEEQ